MNGATKTVKVVKLYEKNCSDAVQSLRGLLHTVLFLRCLGRLKGVEESINVSDECGCVVNSITYMRIDSIALCNFVEEICEYASESLGSCLTINLVAQVSFYKRKTGKPVAAEEKKPRVSWTEWLMGSGAASNHRNLEKSDNRLLTESNSFAAPPFEIWHFNIGINAKQARTRIWHIGHLLQDVLIYGADMDDLPSLSLQSQTDRVTFPITIALQFSDSPKKKIFTLDADPCQTSLSAKTSSSGSSNNSVAKGDSMIGQTDSHFQKSQPIGIQTASGKSQTAVSPRTQNSFKNSASPPQWWNRNENSPSSGKWENGFQLIRDVIENVPRGGSSL